MAPRCCSAMACTGNAGSTFWQAMKVFNGCNVPPVQTVTPRVRSGAKCFFTSNNSRLQMF